MKRSMFLSLLVSVLFFFGCTGQHTKTQHTVMPAMDSTAGSNSYDYSFKTAHPNAQALMKEDFYWSTIEETGPFGSDDGWEAAQGFREWRAANKSGNPLNYLKDLMANWNYPYFDWHEMDTTKMKAYIASGANLDEATIQQKVQQLKEAYKNIPDTSLHNISDAEIRKSVLSSARGINGIFLLGQDNAIIGAAFAQLALEGSVDPDLKELAITAIKRQLLPMLMREFRDDYLDVRKEQLTKMLGVMSKA